MYSKGAEAFAILVDAIDEIATGNARPAEEDAALLWASLHGYGTLRWATPGFPWFVDDEHVCGAMVRRTIESRRAT